MQRDVEKVEEIYGAYDKRDTAALTMLMAKDVEIVQSSELPWGGIHLGQAGLSRFLGSLAEHLDSRVEIERLIDAGDRIVAVGRTFGTARATRLEFDVPFVHVWTFHEGQVARFEAYIDNATMLTALGA